MGAELPGLLRRQTDPLGIVTRYAYTALGQLGSVTQNYVDGFYDPALSDEDLKTTYTYDASGRVLTVTDPVGRVTFNEYDNAGNLTRLTRNYLAGQPQNYQNAYNLIMQYEYDDAGRQVKTIDTVGRNNRTCYDASGRVVRSVMNATGDGGTPQTNPCNATSYIPSTDVDKDRITDAVYDSTGNVIKMIDPAGRVTYTCYDVLNRPVKVIQNPTVADPCQEFTPSTDADKDVIRKPVYDAAGNVIATIDRAGVIARTYYDALNRPSVVVQNLFGQTIDYPTPPAYDSQFPDHNIGTQTSYDAAGRAYKTLDLTTNHSDWTCYDKGGRMTRLVRNATVVDPCVAGLTHTGGNDENIITEYTYDSIGRQIGVKAPDGVITRTYFDDAGRRIATTTNLVGQLITDPNPPPHNPASPDQNITARWTYDALGQVVKTITAAGSAVQRVDWTCYDAAGRVVRMVANAIGDGGMPQTNPCDSVNYVPATQPDKDAITQTVYDAAGNMIAMIDPAGTIARTYFDALGRPRFTVQNLTVPIETPIENMPAYDPGYPDRNVRQETRYDAAGRAFEAVDNAGMVTRTNYDLLDRPIAVTTNYVPGGQSDNQTNLTEQTVYNRLGDDVQRIDANANVTNAIVTAFEYDALHRLKGVIENYRLGAAADTETNVRTEYRYDGHGNRLAIRDARATLSGQSYETTFSYDALDRPKEETDPLGNKTSYGYDLSGQRGNMTDANGKTTTFTYDGARRLTTIDYPTGTTDVASGYDAAGNRISMTDATGSTTWTLDGLYRPTAITAPSGQVNNGYDILGNRIALTYPDGRQTQYGYDKLYRLTGVNPVGSNWNGVGVTAYVYNAAGLPVTSALGAGITVSYTYDNAHRPKAITYQTATGTLSSFTYTLDAMGQRTAVTETVKQPPATASDLIFADGFESGNLSAWTSSTTDGGDLSVTASAALVGAYGLQAVMDDNNPIYLVDDTPDVETRYRARFYFDPISITMANGDTHVIFYGYHNASTVDLRINLRRSSGNYQIRVSLLDDGTTWTNSGWYTITDASHFIEIDWKAATAAGQNNGRLKLWIDETLKETLSNIDNDTRRIRSARLGPVAGVGSGTRGTYYFDAFESRSQTYIGPADVVATTVITYSYDPLYRLTRAAYSDGSYFAYTYDSYGNRLTETACTGGAGCTSITTTYTYDIANRLTTVNGVTNTWDANGNLLNDGARTYTYDAANRLIQQTQGTNTYTFAYNGLGDRVSQTVNGTPTNYKLDLAAGFTQVLTDGPNTYLYGMGRIGEQQPGGFVYHLSDALGSVRQLAYAGGAVTLARNYEPYGDTLSSAGSGATAFQFTGEMRDASGLTYLRARYLSTGVGRFITRDTWGGDYQRPLSLNHWGYVEEDPINRVDPSGMFSPQEIAAGFRHQTFTQVLDFAENQDRHPRWGLLAALLDARDGDTITAFALNLDTYPGLFQTNSTQFFSKNGEVQGAFTWLVEVWMRMNVLGRHHPWRDGTATHYYLRHALPPYVDGGQTDLPDFHSVDVGLGIGARVIGGSLIVDRFGQKYRSFGPGASAGYPIGITLMEGYVVADRHDFLAGKRPLIETPEAMVSAMTGWASNISAGFFFGVGCSAPLSGTASAVIYWEGVSAGASVSVLNTRFTRETDSSMGWNSYLYEQLNGITRADVVQKAAQYGGGLP